MLTSFYIFQKLIKLPMNLNLHFVPMNVCKISDQYLKGKLFYFFHNINFNFNFSIRSPDFFACVLYVNEAHYSMIMNKMWL